MSRDPGFRIVGGVARRLDNQPVCDFCLGPDPSWEYPAAPMPIKGAPAWGQTDDEWAACDECSRLIDQSSIGALVERCVHRHRELWPDGMPSADGSEVRHPPLPIARRKFRENFLRFLDARRGPRRPVQFS